MKKLLSVLLIVFGAGVIFVAVVADFLGLGSDPGMGTRQILVAIVGFVALLSGLIQRYNLNWRRMVADSSPPVTWGQLLIMAAWFGLLTGFVELLVRKWFVNIIFNLNPHLFWMKALANLVLFTIIGLILLPVVRRWPKVVPLRVVTFIFIFLGCLTPLLQFPQLDIWARVLLAMGLGVQLSWLVATHSTGFHTLVRRSIPWMFVLAAGASCMGIYGSSTLSEDRSLAKLPPARPNAPNVLLLVLDTVRAQSLSLYGYHRPTTPRLEQFAKTGILFERALSTSPWTLPSHATMFTGRFTHELFGEEQTPLDATVPLRDEYPTLAEVLSNRGYATAGFVANVGYCASAYGLSRGFARYEDYMPSLELLLGSSALVVKLVRQYRELTDKQHVIERKSAEDVNKSFLRWLSRREGRPFFAFLNYYDAHDPYLAPYPFELKFGSKKPKDAHIVHGRKYKSHEVQELQDAYDSCIAYIDHAIGSLLDKLQEQGVHENTVVIITSDHGEQFGEHGLMYHANSLYSQLLHVPLLISFSKNLPGGKRVRQPVSLRDLPNTVIDLVGIDNIAHFPGSSLARYWDDAKASANGELETLFAEVLIGGETPNWFQESWPVYKGSMKSLVSAGYHYIRYGDGNEELFDFENDPKEEHDHTYSKEDRAMLKRMRLALETTLALSPGN